MNDEAMAYFVTAFALAIRTAQYPSHDPRRCVASRNAAANPSVISTPAALDQRSATGLRANVHRS